MARIGLSILLALLITGCVTSPVTSYQPTPNPQAKDRWHYQLNIDPPLPADQVRVDVIYTATQSTCPVSQVGLRIDPGQRGQNLTFDVLMDQFTDPRCGWHANQIWVGIGKTSGYGTRFSLPVGSAPQVRWCRLNPQHGACLSAEDDIRAYKVPGLVHKVTVLRGE